MTQARPQMQGWALPPPELAVRETALARVIEAMGRPQFAASALAALGAVLRVGSWAVYRLQPQAPPTLHLSASLGLADTTASCFRIYRDAGLYQRDGSFAAVRHAASPGQAVMLRMHAHEAPSADHREAIYARHGMLERLSVARAEADGSLLAVNLYRHAPQPLPFQADEIAHFGALAPALLAAVTRHLAWAGPAGAAAQPPPPDRRAQLRHRCAQLTERELDVLERMLAGMTYDGIAADLGLSMATVKTYRLRAFERLGLHFKSELFASFMPQGLSRGPQQRR